MFGRLLPNLLRRLSGKAAGKADDAWRWAQGLGSKSNAPNGIRGTTADSITEKLQRYLLNPDHPVGRDKAKWFREALGFTQDNLDDLARQIKHDPATAVQTAITEHGTKFNQVIEIVGANGKRIQVNFGWIRNNDGIVRLVTGIPTRR